MNGQYGPENLGALSRLPPGAIEGILLNVSVKDLAVLSCCSRSLWRLCQSEHLWKRIWLHLHVKDIRFQGSWKRTVLSLSGVPEKYLPHSPAISCGPASQSLYHQRIWFRCHYEQDSAKISIPQNLSAATKIAGDGLPGHDGVPVFWSGLMDSWTTSKWTQPEEMASLLDTKFRVEKPSAGSGMISLRDYFQYARLQHDEDPLYIFDGDFASRAPSMAEDYRPPEDCPVDMFAVLGGRRPDYRWLIMGPCRSGSTWHQDPSGTCAWNALVAGKKRWLFYPPDRVPPGVKITRSEDGSLEVQAPNPVQWLLEVYPFLDAADRPFERLQQAGEIVFLPSQWWHFIINMTDTIAVTENFVPEFGLEAAVRDLALGSGNLFQEQEICITTKTRFEQHKGNSQQNGRLDSSNELLEDRKIPPNGFLRSRSLGPWMRALAIERPHLLTQLCQLGKSFASLEQWMELVSRVCASLEIPAPKGHECFPISGGPSVLFQIGQILLKFYTRKPTVASLDAYAEITTLKALTKAGTKDSSSPSFPKLLASSKSQLDARDRSHLEAAGPDSTDSDADSEEDEVDISRLQWSAMTACEGVPADTLGELPLEVCRQIGIVVATLHGLGPIQASLPITNGSSKGAGCAEDKEHTIPMPFFKDEEHWEETEGHPGWSVEQPWGPFLGFLKRRRSEVCQELFSSASLPKKLALDLENYLPKDVQEIVVTNSPPTWLHGDLSSGNILIQEGRTDDSVHINLVDFGDSGFGEALYDFIPLHIDAFGCNQDSTLAFIEAYMQHSGGNFPVTTDSCSRTSYRAMCYTLLHEQDLLHEMFSHHPEWWEAQSLQCLEEWLWGFLNNNSL